MSSSGVNLENHQIPVEEIIRATDNFDATTRIGDGGFGFVHKGQLSERWQNRVVAIKRLDRNGYQGNNEFRNELKLISSLQHPNIISFIGYSDDANEMIIASEYAINGSLDRHLQDLDKRQCLTWTQRLEICLGAARGLGYLHGGRGKDNKVIHRDIKSGNILLDENMKAKICDFGLSKQGLGNQQGTQIYTRVAGTNYYLDPIYYESGILRKESDVYSFGVVMFEMLSGMLVYNQRSFSNGKPQTLINLVRRYYNNKIEILIDPLIKDQIENRCFDMFKTLAYQCISYNSMERPTMDTIVTILEDAMNIQAGNILDSGPTTEDVILPKPIFDVSNIKDYIMSWKPNWNRNAKVTVVKPNFNDEEEKESEEETDRPPRRRSRRET